MLQVVEYNRRAAVYYAIKWAYFRNPKFYNFDELGGDCTNFVSQCLYAGSGVMNFTPIYGWYYISPSDRSASWAGVEYLYNFLVTNEGEGPFATETGIEQMEIGDVIQLGTAEGDFYHSLIITQITGEPTLNTIRISTHTMDSNLRRLSTYDFEAIRFLHINGVRKPQE